MIEDPVTGERVIVRLAASADDGGLFAADFYARPGAAVVGEHTRQRTTETFTVVRGSVGLWHLSRAGASTAAATPSTTSASGVVEE